jgi:hypothetical protein
MPSKYVAPAIPQKDGSACQFTNCWCAVGAYLVKSGTRGRKDPTPMEFRAAAGALAGCRTGGLGDLVTGCRRMGVRATLLLDVPKATARTRFLAQSSTKVYGLATDFEVWPDRENCQPDFDGYHMVAVVPWREKGQTKAMDPLCSRLNLVDVDAVLRAAIEYEDDHGQRHGTIDMVVVSVPPRP